MNQSKVFLILGLLLLGGAFFVGMLMPPENLGGVAKLIIFPIGSLGIGLLVYGLVRFNSELRLLEENGEKLQDFPYIVHSKLTDLRVVEELFSKTFGGSVIDSYPEGTASRQQIEELSQSTRVGEFDELQRNLINVIFERDPGAIRTELIDLGDAAESVRKACGEAMAIRQNWAAKKKEAFRLSTDMERIAGELKVMADSAVISIVIAWSDGESPADFSKEVDALPELIEKCPYTALEKIAELRDQAEVIFDILSREVDESLDESGNLNVAQLEEWHRLVLENLNARSAVSELSAARLAPVISDLETMTFGQVKTMEQQLGVNGGDATQKAEVVKNLAAQLVEMVKVLEKAYAAPVL